MYKNVLNQYTIGVILLFSSCFASYSQTINENSTVIYASAGIKSCHLPANTIKVFQKAETDNTTCLSHKQVLVYSLPSFTHLANNKEKES
jgi:hypothetical protein